MINGFVLINDIPKVKPYYTNKEKHTLMVTICLAKIFTRILDEALHEIRYGIVFQLTELR